MPSRPSQIRSWVRTSTRRVLPVYVHKQKIAERVVSSGHAASGRIRWNGRVGGVGDGSLERTVEVWFSSCSVKLQEATALTLLYCKLSHLVLWCAQQCSYEYANTSSKSQPRIMRPLVYVCTQYASYRSPTRPKAFSCTPGTRYQVLVYRRAAQQQISCSSGRRPQSTQKATPALILGAAYCCSCVVGY